MSMCAVAHHPGNTIHALVPFVVVAGKCKYIIFTFIIVQNYFAEGDDCFRKASSSRVLQFNLNVIIGLDQYLVYFIQIFILTFRDTWSKYKRLKFR